MANIAGISIDMYERFIDDSNLVSEVMEPRWIFCKETGTLNFDEDRVPQNTIMNDDKRTALVIKDVANSIHPMIQMEEDFPSNHEDYKIPILDLKCWMDEDGIIRFQHYEKPMASKLILSANSFLPMKQKRNIHTNECVRKLRSKHELEKEKRIYSRICY